MKKQSADIQQLFEENQTNNIMTSVLRQQQPPPLPKLKATQKVVKTPSVASKPSSSTTAASTGKISRSRLINAAASRDILTPNTAVQRFGDKLTPYELEEIKSYHKIYCLGLFANKIGFSADITSKNNYDYDNGDHFYRVIPNDHIAYRYEVAERPLLGQGTFGQVIKSYDMKDMQHVALKIVRNEKDYLKQSRDELRILHVLKKHDIDGTYNIVTVKEFFMFRNHMVMSFELLGMNLYQVIKMNKYRGLQMPRIKSIAKCVLKSLELLFKLRIIHCDVKPENILLRRNGDYSSVKLADFGSSCYEQSQIYHYIQSRYYRAPEVILGFRYGPAIDMWSLGCVLSELATGTPVFTGQDEFDQLAAIEEMLGAVPPSMINRNKQRPPRKKTRGPPGSKSLKDFLIGDDLFKNLVKQMLEMNPELRPTPLECQEHQWLGSVKLPTPKSRAGTALKKNESMH